MLGVQGVVQELLLCLRGDSILGTQDKDPGLHEGCLGEAGRRGRGKHREREVLRGRTLQTLQAQEKKKRVLRPRGRRAPSYKRQPLARAADPGLRRPHVPEIPRRVAGLGQGQVCVRGRGSLRRAVSPQRLPGETPPSPSRPGPAAPTARAAASPPPQDRTEPRLPPALPLRDPQGAQSARPRPRRPRAVISPESRLPRSLPGESRGRAVRGSRPQTHKEAAAGLADAKEKGPGDVPRRRPTGSPAPRQAPPTPTWCFSFSAPWMDTTCSFSASRKSCPRPPLAPVLVPACPLRRVASLPARPLPRV
ncbi:vegetative cell wall protein gp1-like [Sarcophilus harrisii]|uniref:vegetative cell wall protein gp1-like n=1 Tax=Sarcophilus harrisii TaxID=9305 RepID=UPI001301E1EA|nr:vegetative cell wall protein gp1-like [Sarcophilus harrisii]